MDHSQALSILGLSGNPSPDQIQARFRELARDHHPDAGGDQREMALLIEARDAALGERRSTQLVPLDEVKLLVRAAALDMARRGEAHSATSAALRGIKHRRTSSLRSLKSLAGSVAVVSGIMGLVSSGILPALEQHGLKIGSLSAPLIMMAGLMGIFSLVTSRQVEVIDAQVEELGDELKDKGHYLELLYSIAPEAELRKPWSRTDLERLIDDWLHNPLSSASSLPKAIDTLRLVTLGPLSRRGLLRRIGAADLAKLMTSIGIERGVLEELESLKENELKVRYAIQLKPRPTVGQQA
jgi:hypothetical protein